jgi:hypothetical protein
MSTSCLRIGPTLTAKAFPAMQQMSMAKKVVVLKVKALREVTL